MRHATICEHVMPYQAFTLGLRALEVVSTDL